ncbi:MAG: hypothetical protein ACR2GC_10145 [Methyloceanibacter sp.]|uniref:hypothetical protein n=1 Tax=Methyloceanibacter sp. TaxID=1965321 RepID=UPI003D9BCA1C
MVDRRDLPDWGPGGETRAVVPTTEPTVQVPTQRHADWGDGRNSYYVEAALAEDVHETPDEVVAHLSDAQFEQWDDAALQITADHPDLEGFAERFDWLPGSVRRKVIDVVLSRPHLRGAKLTKAVLGKLTLAEAAAAEEWAQCLTRDDRAFLTEEE